MEEEDVYEWRGQKTIQERNQNKNVVVLSQGDNNEYKSNSIHKGSGVALGDSMLLNCSE